MKSNIEYGLHGAFKVDIFDAKNEFVETTDWFDNFITQSGLMYPLTYSFANCFRFLTLGRSAINNKGGEGGLGTDTYKCADPITSFSCINGGTVSTQSAAWMGDVGYETGDGSASSSCLTQITSSGFRFYRAWAVPSGADGTAVNEDLLIQELTVSPSSGDDPKGCWAFSRVKREIPLKQGYRTIVNYQLQVNCKNYDRTPFYAKTFITGGADISTDADLIKQWSDLSGYYKQVWPGLSCIDYHGAAFIPKYGNGMEPSLTNLNNYFIYFSPDNASFDVNAIDGGLQTNTDLAWASDGVMKPISKIMALDTARGEGDFSSPAARHNTFYGPEQTYDGIPTDVTPFNIRLGNESYVLKTANVKNYSVAPTWSKEQFNYQESTPVEARAETISYATPGASGMSFSDDGGRDGDTMERAIFSSRLYKMPLDQTNGLPNDYDRTMGRKKKITRRAIFTPANSLGYNTRFGSMVFAYKVPGGTAGNYTYYPLMDTLFYDNSGKSMTQHYRLISGIYLTERGTGVAGCSITIRNGSDNIQKFQNRRTFQGPLTGYVQIPPYLKEEEKGFRLGNLFSGWNGTGIKDIGGTSGNYLYSSNQYGGCYGWGAVYGVSGDDYNDGTYYFDQGIAEHQTGSLTQPTELYWPYAHQGSPLSVDFHDIIFYKQSEGTLWPDNPSFNKAQLAAASGFCRPEGYIWHFDNIGPEGYRLLPNYGMANLGKEIADNKYYPPQYGGSLPAFSRDNGMEVYLDITWSSDCKGTEDGTCVETH